MTMSMTSMITMTKTMAATMKISIQILMMMNDDCDNIHKMKKHGGHNSFNSCTGDGGLSWT